MAAWMKLHTDMYGDPKLMRAARHGATHLGWLPWLMLFAKVRDDHGRLSVGDTPAEPEDIAPGLPGATAADVAACIAEAQALGILVHDEDGVLKFRAWEARNSKPSDSREAWRERQARSRGKKKGRRATDKAPATAGVTRDVTPVTPPVTRDSETVSRDGHAIERENSLSENSLSRSEQAGAGALADAAPRHASRDVPMVRLESVTDDFALACKKDELRRALGGQR